MGYKIEGFICISCKSPIEGANYISCNRCNKIMHRTDYCLTIHSNTCSIQGPHHHEVPNLRNRPDMRDIYK